jgi:GGDEF domain-containing protein
MISLRSSIDDLDQSCQLRELTLDCYLGAIRNIANYAIELEPATTALHRKYLEDLALQVSSGSIDVLHESRATVRGLLRDYRDQAAHYLAKLRQDLADAVSALELTLDALGQTDGDHDVQLRGAIAKLRALPDANIGNVREIVQAAAVTIEDSLDQVRKQHKVTVSQFLLEIRMLHKRIDAMESASALDSLTALFNREEMEARIRSGLAGKSSVLLMKASGLRTAEAQFGRAVAEELAGAFTKRLRHSLPSTAIIGRWAEEEFLAILQADQTEGSAIAKRISDSLAGAYACLKAGKTVRPAIHLRVGLVDPRSDDAERLLQRIAEFLNTV